ncbi:Translation initiation factor IF-2, mitochondrial [Nakaseomyces bracarensis]|uniref:Translation initiation factor IF-2, mitochondrial n=1 Tax=Nakaseomyces bracarensis TaxID=273131 RepID=A0ABR4NQ76_9SACH
MLKPLFYLGRSTTRCPRPIAAINYSIRNNFSAWSLNYSRNNKLSRRKKRSEPKPLTFTIPNYISVNKLSNLINCRVEDLVRDLKKLGFENVTNNYILSKEFTELILQEYNYDISTSASNLTVGNVYDELKSPINPTLLQRRPPVVTIMGHVDHGKTTIIDYLRKSSVVELEHGGITQHIGAFQVVTPVSNRKITFLDTPGHAAFLKMRERGANITDIIVLVVSVEDSVMPQTIEAIKHIKKSGNQLIVAITKMDKIHDTRQKEKMLTKVENDLIGQGIEIEKIGGDVQVIPISAKSGENMELLEESIVILSDIMDIRAENAPKTVAEGWILESKVKKTIGNAATVLIKKGTVKRGDILICGNTYCKVRNMKGSGDGAEQVQKAPPAEAVEISGWKELPDVGDEIIQVKSEAIAKKYIAKRIKLEETEKDGQLVERMNERRLQEAMEKHIKANKDVDEDLDEVTKEEENKIKEVNFIVKTDVSGSVEAIVGSIANLGNNEVCCKVVEASVGIPTEGDLKMANITNSQILCFNLGALPNDVLNNKLNVKVRQYNVIYKLIEDVTQILIDNLTPIFQKKFLATVEIRDIFEYNLKKKIIKIAGCKVVNGQINRNSLIQITRGEGNKIVYEGKLATLKHGKDDIAAVTKGHECGITFENNFEDYKKGDSILVYENVKQERFL